jgi:hypothetical protein
LLFFGLLRYNRTNRSPKRYKKLKLTACEKRMLHASPIQPRVDASHNTLGWPARVLSDDNVRLYVP